MTARLKRHMFRRLLSCLLAVAFLVCLLPAPAYGVDELDGQDDLVVEFIALTTSHTYGEKDEDGNFVSPLFLFTVQNNFN